MIPGRVWTTVLLAAFVLGCAPSELAAPSGAIVVHEGFVGEGGGTGEPVQPTAGETAGGEESGEPSDGPSTTTGYLQPGPAPLPGTDAAGSMKDRLRITYAKAADGYNEDEAFGIGNWYYLDDVPLGKVPAVAAPLMGKAGEAVFYGSTATVSDFDEDTPVFVHTHRYEVGSTGIGYDAGLEYRRLVSTFHWLKARMRLGFYITPYAYVSGGMGFQRAFPAWEDLFDSALTMDFVLISLKATIFIPTGTNGGGIYATGFMEGEALDATAAQGIEVSYYPVRNVGVTAAFERGFLVTGFGETNDVVFGVDWDINDVWSVGFRYTDREYVGMVPPGDQDTLYSVELNIRM
ncbi:MAG: hypothetical protein JW909_10885 [Planctomycetes bacterium]|nr:hypothetical protein [Planctomycetota bacterium]